MSQTLPTSERYVGILGGSFNPVHFGHLRVAEEVAEALSLERVIFVPSARPPHKRAHENTSEFASAAQRLAWTRLAIEGREGFEVDPLELERQGPSYSVDTLTTLRAAMAPAEPVFILGHDAFVEIASWWKPEEVLALANVLVVTRPPVLAGSLERWTPEQLRGAYDWAADGLSGSHRASGSWLRQLAITALDISASGIRERIRSASSIRYLLPESVRLAILQSGAYIGGEEADLD